jgi:hypothetical protein
LRGSQFEDKSCTRLAVREPTFLMVDSRKSRDTAKNETSRTTENSTIENHIIDRAIIILPWCCVAFAIVEGFPGYRWVRFDRAFGIYWIDGANFKYSEIY